MAPKTSHSSLFIAQPGLTDSVPAKVYYPLGSFYRYEISFLQQVFNIPLYPDQTNVSLENTRAQVRYILLPLIKRLGFGPIKKEQKFLPSTPRTYEKDSMHQQRRPKEDTIPAIQTLVLATKNHLRFELPGTRTPNCPIKSRELYH